jgi:hypothetical protein
MKLKEIGLFVFTLTVLGIFPGCAKEIGDSVSAALNNAFPSGPAPSPTPTYTQSVTVELPIGQPTWVRGSSNGHRHLVREQRNDMGVTLELAATSKEALASAVQDAAKFQCSFVEGKSLCDFNFWKFSVSVDSMTLAIPQGGVSDSYFELTPLSVYPATTADLHLLLLGVHEFSMDDEELALLKNWVDPAGFITVSELQNLLFMMNSDDHRLELIQSLGKYVIGASDDQIKGYMGSSGFRSDENTNKAIALLKQLAPKPASGAQ